MGYRDYKNGKEQTPIGLETEFSRNLGPRRSSRDTHMQRTLRESQRRKNTTRFRDVNETGEQMGRLIMDGVVRRSTRRKRNVDE